MDALDYYIQAQLALAAYGTFTPRQNPSIGSLTADAVGMTETQAEIFAAQWFVVDQYTDPATGLSATVFAPIAENGQPTSARYLAVKGSVSLLDYAADLINVSLLGSGAGPGQYSALAAQVLKWQNPTDGSPAVLPSTFTVAGHSLGGFLATSLLAHFGTSISNAYLFNAPGIGGVSASSIAGLSPSAAFATEVARMLLADPTLATIDSSKIVNVKSEAGISMTAAIGTQVAPLWAFTEPQAWPWQNHSIVLLTDALAVQACLAQIDQTLTLATGNTILARASAAMAASLETVVNNLAQILIPGSPTRAAVDNRDSLYATIGKIQECLASTGLPSSTRILATNGLSPQTLVASAMAGNLGVRYALANELSFVLTCDQFLQGSIYGNVAIPGSEAEWANKQYWTDRANMLTVRLQANAEGSSDGRVLLNQANPALAGIAPTIFENHLADGSTDIVELKPSYAGSAINKIIFGADVTATYEGGAGDDRLYGGVGHNTLIGGDGNDTLMSGGGGSILLGGNGNDTYYAQDGDVILDTDGSGKIIFQGKQLAGGLWNVAAGAFLSTGTPDGLAYRPQEDGTVLVDYTPIGSFEPTASIILSGLDIQTRATDEQEFMAGSWEGIQLLAGAVEPAGTSRPAVIDMYRTAWLDVPNVSGTGTVYSSPNFLHGSTVMPADHYVLRVHEVTQAEMVIYTSGQSSDPLGTVVGISFSGGYNGDVRILDGLDPSRLTHLDAIVFDDGFTYDMTGYGVLTSGIAAATPSIPDTATVAVSDASSSVVASSAVNTEYTVTAGADNLTLAYFNQNVLSSDAITFASGIYPDDVLVRQVGNDLALLYKNTGGSLTLPNYFTAAVDLAVAAPIQFNNGTQWTAAGVVAQAQATPDAIPETTADLWQSVEVERDLSTGTFTYSLAHVRVAVGHAITADATAGTQLLQGFIPEVRPLLAHDPAAFLTFLAAFPESQTGLVSGVTRLTGTGGSDVLIAAQSDAILDAGAGNDTIYRNDGGQRVILFGRGDGQDLVLNSHSINGRQDILRFKAGITPGDISVETLTLSSADAIAQGAWNAIAFRINDTGEQLILSNYLDTWRTSGQLQRIEFDDGTVWTSDDLLIHVQGRAPAADNDPTSTNGISYRGTAGNYVFDVGTSVTQGGNSIAAGSGLNTIIFDRGYGYASFYDPNSAIVDGSHANSVLFKSGVAHSDVLAVAKSGGSLELDIAGTADKLVIGGGYSPNAALITSIAFADGTTWDPATMNLTVRTDDAEWPYWTATHRSIVDLVSNGSSAHNYQILGGLAGADVRGGPENDTFISGAGDDFFDAGAGTNTLIFGKGDSHDTFQVSHPDAQTSNLIRFEPDVSLADVSFSRVGGDLILVVGDEFSTLALAGYFAGPAYQPDSVALADGTSVDLAAMVSQPLVSLGFGSGPLTLDVAAAQPNLNGQKLLQFSAGVTPADVEFINSGGDLVIKVGTNGDQLTVPGYFSTGATGRFDSLNFLGGTALAGDALPVVNAYRADGSLASVATNDGQGNSFATNYASDGVTVTSDSWAHADGSHGTDVFNANGSSESRVYNVDDSLATVSTADGQGSTRVETYVGGTLATVSADNGAGNTWTDRYDGGVVRRAEWAHNDGWSGANVFDASGVKTGAEWAYSVYGTWGTQSFNADGSLAISESNDALGNTWTDRYVDGIIRRAEWVYGTGWSGANVFDASGAKTSDEWAYSVYGTGGTNTFNSDGSLAVAESHDALGNTWTNRYVDGIVRRAEWTSETYGFGADIFDANGVKVSGEWTCTVFDSWGTDAFNADGTKFAAFASWTAGDNLIAGEATVAVLQGGIDNDVLWSNTINGTAANVGLLDGGPGADTLNRGSVFVGRASNDTLNLTAQPSVILFNQGDGQDTVVNAVADTTISLGGGIGYSDIALSRSGSDLELRAGSTDKVTLKDWFATSGPQGVTKLQVISEAMPTFDASSSDPLLSKKVQEFDFTGFANGFAQAQAADPTVTDWSLMNQATDFYVSSSDSAALGGDLAEYYGTQGSLAAMGLSAAQSVLTDTNFGAPQTLHGLAALQTGAVRLAA